MSQPTDNTHALLWWPGDGLGTVSSLSGIKVPRKPFSDYKRGDIVEAKCSGFPGTYKAIIFKVGR